MYSYVLPYYSNELLPVEEVLLNRAVARRSGVSDVSELVEIVIPPAPPLVVNRGKSQVLIVVGMYD